MRGPISSGPGKPPRRRSSLRGRPAGGWAPNLTPGGAVRIAILGGIALTLLGLLLVRLWFLQVISGEEYSARAENNRLRTEYIEAPRGKILDRNGDLLVANRDGMNVALRPSDLPNEEARNRILTRLARKVLRVPPRELIGEANAAERQPSDQLVVLAQDVDPPVVDYLSERWRDYPGIELTATYLRTYPYHDLAAHVVGLTGKITEQNIDDYKRRGYLGNETVGVSGVEYTYEQYLKGTPGERTVEVDASGEPTGRGVVSSRLPRPGRNLELTIDRGTQAALQDALATQLRLGTANRGAGVALDPRTGEVLAMASYPTYDPEVFVQGRARAIEAIVEDERKPLLDRPIQGVYPVGSTFKPITALAAMRQGFITPDTVLESPSRITLFKQPFKNFEFESHGSINVAQALEASSDTFFFQLGARFYESKGSPLQEEAHRFGLGEPTGIDLGGEQAGLIHTPASWARLYADTNRYGELDRTWKPGYSIQLAVGQNKLALTPIQMAGAYAAIANGGTLQTPSVARAVVDPNGRVVQQLSRGRPSRKIPIPADQLAAVREGLRLAANGIEGTSTGVFVNVPSANTVAGKTGTAETGLPGQDDHSWYVGYAPADDARIVVAVVVENGGTGASAAAPIVCKTMAANLGFDPETCGSAEQAEAH